MSQTLKIYGPPGTGKTTRLLQLLEQELKQLKPWQLAFLTFTRSARREALERAKLSEDELKHCRTIHAICWRQLGMSRDRMVTPKALREWGKHIGMELSGYDPDPFAEDAYGDAKQATPGDQLLRLNHLGRHRGVHLREMLQDAPPELTWEVASWFTKAYRDWKTQEGLLDFTDLLTQYLDRGSPLRIATAMVDEAQDLSRLQWSVMRKLTGEARRLFIAGDDDQAIFTWAGASADELNQFPADDTEILSQSHRVPRAVMRLAQEVIHRVNPAARQEKSVLPRDSDGEVSCAGYLALKDLEGPSAFVLYRHHHRGRQLAKELEALSLPFGGHGSYLHDTNVELVLSALSSWNRGNTASSDQARAVLRTAEPQLLRTRETEKPMTATEALKLVPADWPAWLEDAMPRIERGAYLRRCVELHGWDKVLQPTITLQSIHQAKGQEADTVVLDTDLSRRAWESLQTKPDDEHRVWFVGVTRARRRLVVLGATNPLRYEL
jgi:DNA helicase-2/ATP-dependent DNA helicase PcrA